MNKLETTIEGLGITIGEEEGEQYCSVKLLPYEGLLFSASLEWLNMAGHLEDGDATHEVARGTINKIIDWAVAQNYNWLPL